MNRTHPFAVRMGLPCGEHLNDESIGNSAVLIEENHPGIALTLGPLDALIQGLGNAAVLPILDHLKTERLLFRTQWVKLFDPKTVVYYNQSLHLGENLGYVLEHPGARVICNNPGADRLRCHFAGTHSSSLLS